MSNGCGFCGQQGHNVDHCPERLEAYHGRPADQDLDLWVLGADGDVWHAAGSFNGHEHACLCGTDVETPLEWSTEDLRWAPDRYADVPVCRECVATLEGTRAETVPDDVTFQTAREIVTDGGQCVGSTERDGCPYCGDTSAPATSHYPPFCNLYHKEKFQDQIRQQDAGTDEDVQTDGGLEEIFRRETIVATDDGIAVGDAAVPRSRTREGGDN
ncbi:hypothetical protein [Natrarchaeobaculum sulfurireducens]|nr:hypothetical protein [Natrarchaeobaculum sulfurireducens]